MINKTHHCAEQQKIICDSYIRWWDQQFDQFNVHWILYSIEDRTDVEDLEHDYNKS